MKTVMRNSVLFFLCLTVLAPLVFYTERLGSFSKSDSEDEFIEEISSISVGGENRRLNLLHAQDLANTLREPVRIVYSENSGEDIESSEESAFTESREHKSRVLSATNDGQQSDNENPIKLVTQGAGGGDAGVSLEKSKSVEESGSRKGERGVVETEEGKGKASESALRNDKGKVEVKTSQQSARTFEQKDSEHSVNSNIERSSPQRVILDARVRQLKDQLIRAKVYLTLGATRNNPQFIRELRLRMKEVQRAVGDSTKDTDLPRNANEKMKAMELTLAKGRQIQDDCASEVKKLRAMIHSTDELLRVHKKQTVFLTQLAAKTLPKGLHCLPLRLSTEYYSLSPDQRQFPNQEKLEDPELYHYALFSDNILAAAVVVNSTVSNMKDPAKHVFHIATDRLNYAAMRMWFLANPPGNATIQVQNIEEFTWLNASYSPVLKQLGSPSMIDYYFKAHRANSDTNLKYRNPKYLSILNHLRFYLPEIFPKLKKVLFLDDDIVVQKDLTGLWSINMKGKVNGAVETCGESFHRFDRYLNFSNPLIAKNFDPRACGWAYGMNVFDLDQWRRQNITEVYHRWQRLNHDRQLWKLGTLPPGLITFWNCTFPLHRTWHVLGLGYNPNVSQKDIDHAAVIHYNGNMKPWLEISLPKYRNYWTKFVDYGQPYLRDCNINP
ncbi:hypothetical protein Scep_013553 [Stephania cephalantha]|uniref:Hexosyltransferase n=1 Tax=Stephania cephalantha TaxID=152367 RepID=A0AAP0JJC6_9MAGN